MSYNFSVGIIGEPMEKFNPQTLSPKADNDEDESEGDDKKSEGRRGFVYFIYFITLISVTQILEVNVRDIISVRRTGPSFGRKCLVYPHSNKLQNPIHYAEKVLQDLQKIKIVIVAPPPAGLY